MSWISCHRPMNSRCRPVARRRGNPASGLPKARPAGGGRRGRSWHSPYGRNLYFSLLYRFDAPMHQLAGLSIAAGVELATLLSTLGLQGHGLKWPNDLLWQGRKLAGILVEVSGESEGSAHAVIGIGLNIDLGEISRLARSAGELPERGRPRCIAQPGCRPARGRHARYVRAICGTGAAALCGSLGWAMICTGESVSCSVPPACSTMGSSRA